MFGIGTGELLLLALIALLVLGPDRMPKLMRDVGKTVGDLRRTSDDLRTEFLNADKALRDPLLDAAAKAAATPAAAKPSPTPTTPAPPAASEPTTQASAPPKDLDHL